MTFSNFEQEVEELLRMLGWYVSAEQIVSHKKVDLLVNKQGEFGDTNRVVVECKFYQDKLSQEQVTKIYANYLPILQERKADSVLLVTENGLHPSAETYVKTASGFQHRTKGQLLNSILDFSSYANGLKQDFVTDPLSKVYVSQRARGAEEKVQDILLDYFKCNNANPIAILGGYGMGKSTLARYVCSVLAEDYFRDRTNRIPILISLGQISSDQSLDGLLGKLFTSDSIIKNYNFPLFMALNRLGRFAIILDGFDEMKKVMSWDALKYNLGQLNRLVCEDSKVVLLGRPTAFLDDAEHMEALKGVKVVNNRSVQIPDWPQFDEVEIAPFSRNEVIRYCEKMILRDQEKNGSDQIVRKLEAFKDGLNAGNRKVIDIAGRPVQLKMLIDILPSFEGEVQNLTVTELYAEFTDLALAREVGKLSRTHFNADERRKFICSLAYEMWTHGQRRQIKAHDIPKFLYEHMCKEGDDDDAILRDLLVGSLMERKGIDGFFFAHRSFQEFLVANELDERIARHDEAVFSLNFATSEIQAFYLSLAGKQGCQKLIQWVRSKIKSSNGNGINQFSEAFEELVQAAALRFNFVDPIRKNMELCDNAYRTSVSDTERLKLLKRLQLTEILYDGTEEEQKSQVKSKTKKPSPGSHRKTGVSRKKHFRRTN